MRLLYRVLGLFVLAVAACASLGPASAQESQSRFAFVVGNDGYDEAPLATAANDAALVADALKAARFDVTGARNLDQDTLRASYREFLAKVTAAGPGAVSVVYLSGYGLQFDGENYFVPPGATIARDADVSLNAIRLSDLIRPLSGAPGRGRAVLLDLAYASPFDKQIQGLAPGLAIAEPEAGTIVAFNSAPGTWAAPGKEPYGAYAQALSEMLREPGLPIEEILVRVRTRTAELTRAAQVPWSAGKIEPALVLLERGADAPAPAVTPDQLAAERAKPVDKMPEATAYSAVIDRDTVKGYEDFVATYPQSPYTKNVRGLLAARREARTWRRTLDVNTQNAYWSYLKRYPRGPHAAEARRRLTRLQAALEPPPTFDPVAYDDPPPPPVEEAYFAGPEVAYYDPGVPPLVPSVFVAAPPPWYQPPPPPAFDDDSDFFLPEVVAGFAAPAWIAPPPYVAPPPVPFMMEAGARPPGWRPFVAIPVALAAGLAAGKLSNRFLDNRRHNLGQQGRPPRQPFIPAISSLPKGANLPAGVRPGQAFVRPATPIGQPGRPGIGQPGVGQPGPGIGRPTQPVGIGRPNNALPGLPAGQPGVRPGGVGQPVGTPLGQPGGRPGNALPGVQPACGREPPASRLRRLSERRWGSRVVARASLASRQGPR
ncbi:MAG: caspase family protein [Rhodoblastus sp.]